MDPQIAQRFVEILAQNYPLASISVFGGEPILALDTTIAIFKTAKKYGVPHRQLLTNGHWLPKFSQGTITQHREHHRILAQQLYDAGVNAVDISLDAFHAECYNIDETFAVAHHLLDMGIKQVQMSPRWLYGSPLTDHYNQITSQLLNRAQSEGIPISPGEKIQSRGNALSNFKELLPSVSISGDEQCHDMPNMPDLGQIRSLCISPLGDLIICNNFVIGRASPSSLLSILKGYSPEKYADINAIYKKGLRGLIDLANEMQISLPQGPFYSICDACFQYRKALGITDICNA